MRKQIVEHRTRPLPESLAQRLQGYNGTPNQFVTNIATELIRGYLQKNYGSQEYWMPPLKRMLENKDLNPDELVAVKRVIKEVNGKEI